jgi:hypothetical protein
MKVRSAMRASASDMAEFDSFDVVAVVEEPVNEHRLSRHTFRDAQMPRQSRFGRLGREADVPRLRIAFQAQGIDVIAHAALSRREFSRICSTASFVSPLRMPSCAPVASYISKATFSDGSSRPARMSYA